MRVEFHNHDGLVGTAVVDSGGTVVVDTPNLERLLADTNVIEPGTFEKLTPGQGERYLRALPPAFRGMYFQAHLVDDEKGQIDALER
jgi:hypothetical protein